jgi:transposase InsO family protein
MDKSITRKEVMLVLQKRKTCQFNKTHTKKTHTKLQPIAPPMNNSLDLSMDFAGPFQNSKNYLLVVIDRTTRYIWKRLFTDMPSTEQMIQKLKDLIEHCDIPIERIVSDNGPQFRSRSWKTYLKDKSSICSLNSTYPQGDGLIERHIQILQKKLRLL